jgi:DNA-binding transcriptional ArsR family regulator/uncharacterized protein YndB with AHSA1/START domain
LDQTQRVIRALGSPVRREILWRVWDDELPVAAIAAGIDVTAPTISQHLTVLREAGLVDLRAEGTTRWYRARRETISALRGALSEGPDRWTTLTDRPERLPDDESHDRSHVAIVPVDAPCSQADAFRAFTDAELYARWLGVPVALDHGHFSCRMEFGTHVRGTYELVTEPSLIAMRWDFDDGAIPVPGAGRRAVLLVWPVTDATCRVEVHQYAEDPERLHRLERAWRLVLDRFAAGVNRALDPSADAPRRPARPRRRPSATTPAAASPAASGRRPRR